MLALQAPSRAHLLLHVQLSLHLEECSFALHADKQQVLVREPRTTKKLMLSTHLELDTSDVKLGKPRTYMIVISAMGHEADECIMLAEKAES